jgi:RNA polymerase sigma factor (TIGR02999 family)
MMRRILVDHARKHLSQKRVGRLERVDLEELDARGAVDLLDHAGALAQSPESAVDLATVDEVLLRLEQLDPQQGKLVELRFFGGLSIEEAADALGVSASTAKREWVFARAWLQRELDAGLLA